MRYKYLYGIGCVALFFGLLWLFSLHLTLHTGFNGHDHADESLSASFFENISYAVILTFFGVYLVHMGNKYSQMIVRPGRLILIGIGLVILAIIGVILVRNTVLSYTPVASNGPVIGNTSVLREINNLLLPLDAKNLSERDFETLQREVKTDEHASDEIEELMTLTEHKEYTHVGHGLGFLYEYIKTGKEPICPGHVLSHYYVFLKDNENNLAEGSLAEARESFPEWQEKEENKSADYLISIDYVSYNKAIGESLKQIDVGNTTGGENQIEFLSEAPCAS